MQLDKSFAQDIAEIWRSARDKAYTLVNQEMIDAYWEIGRRIVVEEQKGLHRAQYGTYLLRELAKHLAAEIDKKLDERELRRIRQFYLYYPNRDALRPGLTWSHYRLVLRIEEPRARAYYVQAASEQGWGTRELERNIQTRDFERRLIHQREPGSLGPAPAGPSSAAEIVKDPYVLEFLGAAVPPGFSENDLETAILGNLQQFLLEMGNGFAFVARQYPIKTDTKVFYIDLVFYNYLLKCFVIVDLKINELTHQDIGQMDMYVRMFEQLKKIEGDNPTIGLILCSEKDSTLVKYSVLKDNEQIFASKYRLILPTEAELSSEIDKKRDLLANKSTR